MKALHLIIEEFHLQRTLLHAELTSGVIGQLAIICIDEINRELCNLIAPPSVTNETAIEFTVSYRELLQQKQMWQTLLDLRKQLEDELET